MKKGMARRGAKCGVGPNAAGDQSRYAAKRRPGPPAYTDQTLPMNSRAMRSIISPSRGNMSWSMMRSMPASA